uniref:Fido domain-containing protein n=1 Tax=Globodera rostochiensis TaxID=31243 RepID=A0A914H651_GLORO
MMKVWRRKEKKEEVAIKAQRLEEIRSGQITPPSLFASDEASFGELESLSTKYGDFIEELMRKLHVIALTREGQGPTYSGHLRGESGESSSGTIRIGRSYVAPIVAKAHIRLAALHPYPDGNGRSSRALVNYLLLRRVWQPFLIPEKEHDEYNKALKGAIVDGKPDEFYAMMSTF